MTNDGMSEEGHVVSLDEMQAEPPPAPAPVERLVQKPLVDFSRAGHIGKRPSIIELHLAEGANRERALQAARDAIGDGFLPGIVRAE